MINPTATIHPQALIEKNVMIGANTRIWAFSHILSNVMIGADCNICDHTLIESGVSIGDRVTIKSGVYLWTGLKIEDDVFIGPCAAFTNDKRPRSKQYPESYPTILLQQGCSIGANATILPDIKIGQWAMVGAGSVVTKDVPAYALVYGNPARIQGWICRCGKQFNASTQEHLCSCGLAYQFNALKNGVESLSEKVS